MNAEDPPSGLALGARVVAIQTALAAFCWLGVGLFNAKGTWLLEPSQARLAARLLLFQLPLAGILGAVLVPGFWAMRLSSEASGPGLLDSDYLRKVLGFPQHGAMAGLVTSVVLFLFAGFRLRVSCAIPPLEAAKIGVLGLLTGTLLSVLSYFSLQAAVQPLVLNAVERGALPPQIPTFPIRKKILAACIAVALLVAGLFGMDAFAWSQRYAEEKTATVAGRIAGDMARQLRERPPQGREAWSKFFASKIRPEGAVLYAQGAGGSLLSTYPSNLPGIEGYLLRSDFFSAGSSLPLDGSFVSRWGDVRIVARSPIEAYGSVGVILRPDPSILQGVLSALLLVSVEAAFAALLLAWISGRGMTGPLRRLVLNTEAFASEETSSVEIVPVVTDDEISNLAAAFDRMSIARREAQKELREASRRAERDELLARVAHEVRNPVFGISSTLAALQTEIANPKYDEYFTVLKTESQRISALVDEMLAAQMQIGPGSRTDLRSVLAEAESVVRLRLPDRPFLLKSRGADGDYPSPLDRKDAIVLMAKFLESAALRSAAHSEIQLEFQRLGQESVVAMRVRGISDGRDGDLELSADSLAVCTQILERVGGEVRLIPAGDGGGAVFEIRVFSSDAPCNS